MLLWFADSDALNALPLGDLEDAGCVLSLHAGQGRLSVVQADVANRNLN